MSVHDIVHDLHPAFQSDHLQPEQSGAGVSPRQGRQDPPGKARSKRSVPGRGPTMHPTALYTFSLGLLTRLSRPAILTPGTHVRKQKLREARYSPTVTQPSRWEKPDLNLVPLAPERPLQSPTSRGPSSPAGPFSEPQLLLLLLGHRLAGHLVGRARVRFA